MLQCHVGLCADFFGPGNGHIDLVRVLALFDMNRLFVMVYLFVSILHNELPHWVWVGSYVYRQVMLFVQVFVELASEAVVGVLLGLVVPLQWFVLSFL